MARLRIALTLSGAISLGAYEGGALAALLIALERIREDDPEAIEIDSIAGASAGSMTGVLAARALLTQDDPLALMHSAWVETPSLSNLRGSGPGAPLSIEKATADAKELLEGKCARSAGDDTPPPQQNPVRLRLALGALRGLDYTFRRLDGPPLDAATYLDWFDVTLRPESTREDYLAALAPAMASGAHAAAFSAQMLRRDGQRQDYIDNGVTNFPISDCLWYTDGGTINNQPLGSALEITAELDEHREDGERLHLLVIPDPSFAVPPADLSWADPDPGNAPTWIWTLPHAAKMAATQSLYDDMRTAEKTNSRLRWVERLVEQLAPRLNDEDLAALARLVSEMDEQRSKELGANTTAPPPTPQVSDGALELLSRAIHAATGLHGKKPVRVDAVSPRLIGAEDKAQLSHQLAGEFLGHFGGFLAPEARESDFALGYESALAWMSDPARGLEHNGVPAALVAEGVAEARARAPGGPPGAGDLNLARLGPRAWAQLIKLVGRAIWLAESGLRSKTGHGSS